MFEHRHDPAMQCFDLAAPVPPSAQNVQTMTINVPIDFMVGFLELRVDLEDTGDSPLPNGPERSGFQRGQV